MPYLQFPQPRDEYCKRHGRPFNGYRCPQCIEDDKKHAFQKIVEPLINAEQLAQTRKELDYLIDQIKDAKIIKETPEYKLLLCPSCHKPSLFHNKHNNKSECLNKRCGLKSTITILTEKLRRL